MKRFMRTLLMGSVSIAATAGLAQAQPVAPPAAPAPMGMPHPAMHHPHPLMLDLPGVTLSDAQKDKIHAILESNRPDPAQMDPQNDPHHQLVELLRSPAPVDHKKLKKLEKQITQEDADHLHKMVDVTLALRSVLTPQQLQQGAENREKLHALRRQMDAIIHPAGVPGVPGTPDAPSVPPAPPVAPAP